MIASSCSFYRPSFSKAKDTKTLFSDLLEKHLSESKLFSTKQLFLFKSANLWNTHGQQMLSERSFAKIQVSSFCLIPINENWKSVLIFLIYKFLYTSAFILNFYNFSIGIAGFQITSITSLSESGLDWCCRFCWDISGI